jgi:pyruvate decarboxylase
VAYKHIQHLLKPNHVVLVDAGDSWFNATKLRLPGGALYEVQMQYASIGWSVGATLGFCAALSSLDPTRRPVLFCGDGAFQMTAQEVSTIVRYGYSPLIFILNNGGYTVEVEIHDGPYNVINNWNYSKLLSVFNPDGERTFSAQVRTEEDMVAAVAAATGEMASRTCLIEVILDKDDCSRELLEFGARLSFQAVNQTAPVH